MTLVLPPHSGLAPLAGAYDVVLSDIWGVLHNGVAAWETACDALARYRQAGGTVILVSNAPRPAGEVIPQLDGFGVPRTAWDDVVTSGDVTRTELSKRGIRRVHHIGPPRDLPLFDGFERVAVEDAEIAVVTGLDDDEHETAEHYRPQLMAVRERGLELICANPDRVVERGETLVPCAGALADIFEEMGGQVLYAGKPYAPVYHEALARAGRLRGADVPIARALMIGDSVRTDLAGANGIGMDCLFLTGGIHGAEVGHPPREGALEGLLVQATRAPVAWAHRLAWDV